MSTSTNSPGGGGGGGGGGAWKTLEEARPTLTSEQYASEKRRRDVGFILGPLLFILFLIIPLPEPLTFKANTAMAITALIMTWWICEPIPMPATSIFGCGLFMLLQVLPAPAVMNALGNSNTWYLMATFIFMNAMVKHGFATRVAYWLLSLPIGRKGPYHLLGLYIFAVGFVSMWLSNMATTMLFLAISTGMITALQISSDNTMSQAMRLGSAFSSQAGGFGTPMGAAGTNFLSIGLIVSLSGFEFTVASWIKVGFPFALIMIVLMIIYFKCIFKIDLPNYQKACDYAQDQLKAMGKMKRAEKLSVSITLLVIICWLLPDAFQSIFGAQAAITVTAKSILNSATVAIIGAVLCFIVPHDYKERKYLMTWTEANRYIDWGALILVVCGIVMGNALAAEDVGILAAVSTGVGSALASVPSFVAVLGMTAFAIVLTQIIANVPAISIMLPVAYAVSTAIGLNPVAMMLTTSFACQQSYALPVASPQMAFVYGTGSVSIKNFFLKGGGLSLICIPVTAIIVYYFAALLFPV